MRAFGIDSISTALAPPTHQITRPQCLEQEEEAKNQVNPDDKLQTGQDITRIPVTVNPRIENTTEIQGEDENTQRLGGENAPSTGTGGANPPNLGANLDIRA